MLRFVLGVTGLFIGYTWTLILLFYLIAQPDWGQDTMGLRRGLLFAIMVTIYSTKWLLGRSALELPFIRWRATYTAITATSGIIGVAYAVDMYNRQGTLTDYPVIVGLVLDILVLFVLARVCQAAAMIAFHWDA